MPPKRRGNPDPDPHPHPDRDATLKVAGLFKLDAETQRPKLKVYKDAAGRRKGDALLS